VSDLDPFSDAAFLSRLQKLISMLGSAQPAEAEAARRKLLEHLGHHRLSLTDIAMRLRDGAPKPSFTQGSRELSLERQLSIARAARQEAEGDAQAAAQRVNELQQALQVAAFDVGRALQAQSRARLVAALGFAAAAAASAAALSFHSRLNAVATDIVHVGHTPAETIIRPDPEAGERVLRLAAGERFGTVLVQDLPVKFSPSDDSGSQTWLHIRSLTGSGWVRSGDILH
jgi:hypothetical protein